MRYTKMTNNEIKIFQSSRQISAVRNPVTVIVENIRSIYNVGSIFRTCDAAAVERLCLCGYTVYPPRKELEKTALGSTGSVPWERHEDAVHLIHQKKAQGYSVVVFEHAHGMNNLYETEISFPLCAVFGNEVDGVSDEVLSLADSVLYIPMCGKKESLNVSVACGVALYELIRRVQIKNEDGG